MAGNAAADAALRLAVLRRGKMWTEEARKSELDLPPMGHPLGTHWAPILRVALPTEHVFRA